MEFVHPEAGKHPWDVLPNEPAKAYKTFKQVLYSGVNRHLVDLYKEIENKPKAKQISGVWKTWCTRYSWHSRFRAYDLEQERLRDEATAKARQDALREHYDRELENYRKAHEMAGKAAFKNVQILSLAILNYAQRYQVNPVTGEARQEITDATEAKQISGIIRDFMAYGPEVWASALGIEELREKLEMEVLI